MRVLKHSRLTRILKFSFREDPKNNNPVTMAKKYQIDIHTATLISLSVKFPIIYENIEEGIVLAK